jgi:hypothetical protein
MTNPGNLRQYVQSLKKKKKTIDSQPGNLIMRIIRVFGNNQDCVSNLKPYLYLTQCANRKWTDWSLIVRSTSNLIATELRVQPLGILR